MCLKEGGILYGISVGPGDWEQMTLQAVRCIKASDVLLLPAASREQCHAYGIAAKACPEIENKEVRCYDFPMTRNREQLEQSREGIYADIVEILQSGKSAAFLVIGDISIYSTYSYMAEKAKRDGLRTVAVNGVTSFCACAGRLQIPLVSEEEDLHIFSGTANLEEALKLPGTKVFMKLGKHLNKLKERLLPMVEAGTTRVFAVSYCGMEKEQIYFQLDEIPEQAGYLTTVIVKQVV
ncbi:MAG: precorrin-2 C(20)-methyltransferase [Lachnospiraceae bacterium]|nr:precorrin-2 C(20)-methyltransferase [Lachnospiraceae bacterium]